MPKRTAEDQARAAQVAALADFQAGRVAKEFTAKCLERRLFDKEIERVLKSRSSGVWRYTHLGQPRYGLWHPHTKVFIAWQPHEEGFRSELKTCFRESDGLRYMERQEGVVLLRRPKR
jgi:hypothetical protein